MAADEAFIFRRNGKPSETRALRGRARRRDAMLLHEGFEQAAQLRRLFVALRIVGVQGDAGGQFRHDIRWNGNPQRETLDVGAGTPREQHRHLKRRFHRCNVLGGYQDRLHPRTSARYDHPAGHATLMPDRLILGNGQRKPDWAGGRGFRMHKLPLSGEPDTPSQGGNSAF